MPPQPQMTQQSNQKQSEQFTLRNRSTTHGHTTTVCTIHSLLNLTLNLSLRKWLFLILLTPSWEPPVASNSCINQNPRYCFSELQSTTHVTNPIPRPVAKAGRSQNLSLPYVHVDPKPRLGPHPIPHAATTSVTLWPARSDIPKLPGTHITLQHAYKEYCETKH